MYVHSFAFTILNRAYTFKHCFLESDKMTLTIGCSFSVFKRNVFDYFDRFYRSKNEHCSQPQACFQFHIYKLEQKGHSTRFSHVSIFRFYSK